MIDDETILRKIGRRPGKSVAIFAGIHGNELAGVRALKRAIKEVELEAGTAYFVIANPLAVRRRTRMITKNLNRCFYETNKGTIWEDKRARQLMKLLDRCDALLDLHGYNGEEDSPFVITDNKGLVLARELDVASVLTGISDVANGGTDCYMASHQKIGLCLECGSNFYPDKYVPLATRSIQTFLGHYGLIKKVAIRRSKRQTVYRVDQVVKRQTDNFSFDKDYVNFDKLETGREFAHDGETKFIAKENQYIIFPRSKQKVGEESFILINKLKKQ